MSVFDLAFVVSALSDSTIEIVRYAADTYTLGRLNDPTVDSTFEIRASVQPTSGDDVKRLPEGLRQSGTLTVFTTTELRSADTAAATKGDRFTYDGKEYEITGAEGWGRIGNYFKNLALLVPLQVRD